MKRLAVIAEAGIGNVTLKHAQDKAVKKFADEGYEDFVVWMKKGSGEERGRLFWVLYAQRRDGRRV